ncbi:MAG TPA: pyridoxal-phosphate dependent enzyme [Candidatus Limnocylindrales bacterium]|nr:pyridoxal-phosphate dependent enzyme [Candidatus Limnocylindrales bacterium]
MTAQPEVRGRPATEGRFPTWFACSGCGTRPADGAPVPLVCPASVAGDGIDHVLVRHLDPAAGPFAVTDDPNPFVAYRRLFHAWHAARAAGWSDEDYVAMVERLDNAVAEVDGHGFRVTPFARNDALSVALGLSQAGGVWVKDETGNVSGSHKARHLFGTLLELEVGAGATADAPLAIASCGNAALAAAVVARAADRRLLVFIPTDADPAVVTRLRSLGAELTVCDREPGVAGDPTYLRLLEAVAEGAVPFTCQGNLNAFAVEGGETLGFEMASAVGQLDGPSRIDRVVIQVGGGALASSVIAGFANAGEATMTLNQPQFDTVQTRGAFPLARAHERVAARVTSGETIEAALAFAANHRPEFMWPWEETPHSIAHGILDDETYDWRAVVAGMLRTGGAPIVVDEATLHAANDLARASTGIDVDHTGSSGLAGLLHLARSGALDPDENVVVCFSGITRHLEKERTRS